jgi:hypothetical protein
MARDVFRIGNAAGFSGPAALFFEVLGERTVALAQLERRRDPSRGYEPMLERLIAPILERCARNGIPIIGNFGAANPPAAAAVIAALARSQGLRDLRIATVAGDDVRHAIALDTAEVYEADAALPVRAEAMIAANAYLGAGPVVEALAQGAEVVVVGRIADPALALAPLLHHFGWAADDWDRLAIGATAGHLLECGSQVTGGVFYDPGCKDIPDPANIGFPIAEVDEAGGLVITKADDTGGLVDLRTVKEQLLYEVHDPSAYVTPDVVLDFTGISLEQVGRDRVAVRGMRGRAAPERLKVTVSFEGGWLGEGEFSLAGPNALARARLAGEVLRERLRRRRLDVRARVDLIGVASVHDDDAGTLAQAYAGPDPEEIRVRLAVAGDVHDDVDQAVREVLAMLCCGPAGSGGARWRTTPRIHTRSYLLAREAVPTSVQLRAAWEFNA